LTDLVLLILDGKLVEIIIEIIQEKQKKVFLGGFKHRLTGVEYHNAAAQTMPKTRVPSPVERFHRDTQTYKLRNRVQQTTNVTSTQMVRLQIMYNHVFMSLVYNILIHFALLIQFLIKKSYLKFLLFISD